MERNKALKKISGDSVVVESITPKHPKICKTIGGATYIARMHFNDVSKLKIEDKLLRLMEEDVEQGKR